MLKKILIPLDGSKLGELSLVYAKELAYAFNSELHLVCVVEKRDLEYRRRVEVYLQKIIEETQRAILDSHSKAVIKFAVINGIPAGEIVQYAQQKRMSLVVIVSHGYSGIMPWTMGSTANKVVHTIENPVLLVRASMFSKKRQPVKLFSKIIAPLDGSEMGEAALPYVRQIARKLNSEVILFSVIESGQHVHTIGGQDFIRFPQQQIESTRIETDKYLLATSKKLADSGVNVRSIVKEGDAASEIIKYAKEKSIRLVAMSSHGRSGMRGWVFGSVSNKVLQVGKTPLLLVRALQTAVK